MSRVLITGANRGLGLEFARQYADDGWEVIATSRHPEKSAELQLLEKKNNLSVKALDVTSGKSVEALAHALSGQPIDLLVLNSAIYTRIGNKIGEIDFEAWREAIETNLLGAVRVAQALLENVAASKRKQIAAISTGMGSMRDRKSVV